MGIMSSGQDVHGEALNKLSSISSALNAVLECHKVLSYTRMEEVERGKFINKLFEILGDVKESMFQHTLEGEYLSLNKENGAGNTLHNELLKNADEEETFKSFSAEHKEACSGSPSKFKLFENQNGKDKVLESKQQQGPAVFTQRLHPSVPRSNGVSFQGTHGFQGNIATISTAGQVSTNNVGGHTPFCFADTNQKRDVQISSPKKISTFSGKYGEKGESCPLSQKFHIFENEKVLSKASFSDVVKNSQNYLNSHMPCKFDDSDLNFHSNVPGSFNNEDSSLFRIDPKALEKRMDLCSFSVVGKVTLSKGDSPWLLKQLKVRIESFWGLKSAWRLISLGKGYYHILLTSKEEWDKVWSRGHLSLKPGTLRLQRWSVDFDPLKEKNTNAQVWFRIFNLPWCLWEPSVLTGIAKKVGVPIRIDRATLESDLGHYARVLVDIDLAKAFRTSIHVEYGSHVFEVLLVAENIPLFCQSCHAIGHSPKECRLFIDSRSDFSKTNRQKVEAKENRIPTDDLEINGGVKEQLLQASVGKRLNPSVDRYPHVHRNNPGKRKKAMNAPEWKQKLVQDFGNVSDGNVGESHQQHKALMTTEMITDFGAQTGSYDTEKHYPDGICSENQFYILNNLEGIDDERIDEETLLVEDNPCTIIDKVPEQASAMVMQPDIPEGSSVKHSVFKDIMFPKIPEKWGDLLDEEDEIDRTSLPNPPRSIAEIRQGLYDIFMERPSPEVDLIEPDMSIFQKDDAPPILPLSIKKDKKVKIGFRHSKGSSSSPKC